MQEIVGSHNTAKVFTDTLDAGAIAQIKLLCDIAFTAGSQIRIMPDAHAGAGCTIGTTMTILDKAVPNLVGVDIGCGMETALIKETRLDFGKLDSVIREKIPSGMNIRKTPHRMVEENDLDQLRCARHVNLQRAALSIGTLGGGNHFIEVDRDDAGALYVVIHSGSRHIGLEVAEYYQQKAWKQLTEDDAGREELIARLKEEGRSKEIHDALKAFKDRNTPDVPRQLAYVSGSLFGDYIHDMKIIQRFAALNRKAMMEEIARGAKITVMESFTTVHNYIDTDSMILRKGAVSARAGERLIIPINMRDGSLICEGLGNEDWNYSAPHGAGRLYSRTEAKNHFTLNEFKKQMQGIYTTSVGKDTLDECPMAYKDMEEIVKNIGPTARITAVIKPVYNFKASE